MLGGLVRKHKKCREHAVFSEKSKFSIFNSYTVFQHNTKIMMNTNSPFLFIITSPYSIFSGWPSIYLDFLVECNAETDPPKIGSS